MSKRMKRSIPLCLALLLAFSHIHTVYAYIPDASADQNAIIINSTLYVFGGRRNDGSYTTTLLTLDLSQSFIATLSSVPWVLRLNDPGPNNPPVTPTSLFAIAPVADHASFLIWGGIVNASRAWDTLIYNAVNHVWAPPSISGTFPLRKFMHSAATDKNGKIYFFGGESDSATGTNSRTIWNVVSVLDTTNWLWIAPNPLLPPTPRYLHTATMLSSDLMVVIGGLSGIQNPASGNWTTSLVSMNSLDVYDTVHNTWSVQDPNAGTSGFPDRRSDHTAVLAPDGARIIIFGGGTYNTVNPFLNDVFILDTSSSPYTWSKPSVIGTPPSPRWGHSSVIYGDQMLVFFGEDSSSTFSDTFVLDTTAWSWTTSYSPPSVANSKSGISGKGIAGIAAGIAVAVALAITIFWFVRRSRRNRREYKGVLLQQPAPLTTMGTYPPQAYNPPLPPPQNFVPNPQHSEQPNYLSLPPPTQQPQLYNKHYAQPQPPVQYHQMPPQQYPLQTFNPQPQYYDQGGYQAQTSASAYAPTQAYYSPQLRPPELSTGYHSGNSPSPTFSQPPPPQYTDMAPSQGSPHQQSTIKAFPQQLTVNESHQLGFGKPDEVVPLAVDYGRVSADTTQ